MAKKKKAASGLGKSLKSHAQDETDYGRDFIDLPPGITGGIAQLVEAKIGAYAKGTNQGESFVYLGGAVEDPKSVPYAKRVWQDGKVVVMAPKIVETEGQQTGLTLPLCATKTRGGVETDLDEHVDRMLNELRKLGGEDFTEDISDEESLNEHLETLKKAQPFFKFSTSASDPSAEFPEERVWENWRGTKGLEDYSPNGGEDVEEDAEEDEEDEVDIAALAKAADEDDEEAQIELTEKAEELGVDAAEYETWAEVAEAMEGDEEDDEEEDEEEEDEDEEEEEEIEPPDKGDVVSYKPPKKRKAVDCEVTAVFKGKETCTLKNLDDGTTYKGVSWEKVESVEDDEEEDE